jgi:hypothetical protein
MLHKDYNRKDLVEKNAGRVSKAAWRHDKLIVGTPPVVK